MQDYIKIYFKANGYDEGDTYFPSEISGSNSVDVNHIDCKGMGGNPNKEKDRIENLIGLTREEHIKYGDYKKYKSFLFWKHKKFMIRNGVKFDEEYIDAKINKYSHYEE